MKKSVILSLVTLLITGTSPGASAPESVPVFTTETQIVAVSRQDQSNAIKIKMVKREVLLSEVIKVLTTYHKVTRHQYMMYAHQIGVLGTVTLADGKGYTWSIEPGYAATVKSADGEEVYLLRPELKTKASVGGDGKPAASDAETPRGRTEAPPDRTGHQNGLPEDKVDHIAAARNAEQSFHAACDEWSAIHAKKGEDTSSAAAKITSSYIDFMKHVLWTKYIPNAAMLVGKPKQIAGAGAIHSKNGIQSYVIYKGQRGLRIIVWSRAAWKNPPTGLPSHGIAAHFLIDPRELSSKFIVGKADWANADQKILRVTYTLGDVQGVIEIRRDDEHYPWPIHPDRGVMKGDLWLPSAKQ